MQGEVTIVGQAAPAPGQLAAAIWDVGVGHEAGRQLVPAAYLWQEPAVPPQSPLLPQVATGVAAHTLPSVPEWGSGMPAGTGKQVPGVAPLQFVQTLVEAQLRAADSPAQQTVSRHEFELHWLLVVQGAPAARLWQMPEMHVYPLAVSQSAATVAGVHMVLQTSRVASHRNPIPHVTAAGTTQVPGATPLHAP